MAVGENIRFFIRVNTKTSREKIEEKQMNLKKKQSKNKIQNALHNVIHENSTNTQGKIGIKTQK